MCNVEYMKNILGLPWVANPDIPSRDGGMIPASGHHFLWQLPFLRLVFVLIRSSPVSLPPFSSHRALKQVKNWFSNERQKHTGKKDEDVVRMVSAEGERLRLRPIAVQSCKAEEWTDTFFEEVVMIHHLKVSTSLRLDESQHPRET